MSATCAFVFPETISAKPCELLSFAADTAPPSVAPPHQVGFTKTSIVPTSDPAYESSARPTIGPGCIAFTATPGIVDGASGSPGFIAPLIVETCAGT